MFDDVMSISEDGFNLEKALAEVTVPTTKPGEVIKLGNHVLMCGDSTKVEDVAKLMGWKYKQASSFVIPHITSASTIPKASARRRKLQRRPSPASKDKKSAPDYRAFIDVPFP